MHVYSEMNTKMDCNLKFSKANWKSRTNLVHTWSNHVIYVHNWINLSLTMHIIIYKPHTS
jgi:hypothetical protein